MAPSQSTLRDSGNKKKVVTKDIPLPLVPLDRKAPARDECQEFALKADPANPASPEYKFHMRHLKGTEDARSIMAWVDDIQRVLSGLGIVDPIPAYSLYTQCMRGTALSTFETIVRTKCADARSTALAAADDDPAREAIRNRTNARRIMQQVEVVVETAKGVAAGEVMVVPASVSPVGLETKNREAMTRMMRKIR
jgi:hypothetical protein